MPHLGLGVLEEIDSRRRQTSRPNVDGPAIADPRARDEAADETIETRTPMLSFEDVAIDYPKRGRIPAFRAAEDINLAIYPGEIVGLVGESGSGKTTLGPRRDRAAARSPRAR